MTIDELMHGYLRRLGLATRPAPTRSSLDALVRAHLQTVPFENLDIVDGLRPELTTAAVLHKLVMRGRGGFCYELNEAFGALLLHLGFEVRRIEARVWREDRRQYGPSYDHLALLVTMPDGEWLTDVGFGDNNRTPMRLPADELTDLSGHYTLMPVSDTVWRLSRTDRPLYEMTLTGQPLSAFNSMFRYHQSSPDSLFAKGVICTLATANGRVTLSRDRLIVTDAGQRTEAVAADRERVLEQYFGIGKRT
jgi:N-hydroxyarylamine O-acetyltransferase